ncbi:MAG: hypothetical protein OEV21_07015, partial [Thermoplasmata archaeon]|nr:hypothetical protein [Thermoplasmata archaeon]
ALDCASNSSWFGSLSWCTALHFYESGVFLGIMIFLLGVGLSLVTPIGGIIQIVGCVLFRANVDGVLGTHMGHAMIVWTLWIGPGFYIGLIAGALVISSLFLPFGLSKDGFKGLSTWQRLFTWSI